MRTLSLVLPVVAFTLLAACGGSEPAPSAPTPPTPADTSVAAVSDAGAASAVVAQADAGAVVSAGDAGGTPGPKSWDNMSHDERLALMKTVVYPKMKEAFQAFDPKDFADFSCKTCHGEGAKQGKFDMPNPKLPKLDAKSGFKKMTAKHPRAMKFMQETVEPKMAEILGESTWSPSNPTGFSCGECHTME